MSVKQKLNIVYGNMTGAAMNQILQTINLFHVEGTYESFDKHWKTKEYIKNEYIKWTFPVTDRFVSLENKKQLQLFQYKSFYNFRFRDNLLICDDCNDNNKFHYQILLTDDELQNIQKIMWQYKPMGYTIWE